MNLHLSMKSIENSPLVFFMFLQGRYYWEWWWPESKQGLKPTKITAISCNRGAEWEL